MTSGPTLPPDPAAVLGTLGATGARADDEERAPDGEPVGRSDRDADIQRTRGNDAEE